MKPAKARFLIEIMPTAKPSGASVGVITEEQAAEVVRQLQAVATEIAPAAIQDLAAGELTGEVMVAAVRQMQAMAAQVMVDLPVPEPPGPLRRLRITCLRCGKQIGGVVTLASWPSLLKRVAAHECAAGKDRHWHKVVRDAFLEGRDAEAIAVMRSNVLDEEP